MLEAMANQQDTFGIRKGSRLFLIPLSIELNCACQPVLPLIQKSKEFVFDHSMFRSDMEFFISSVDALINDAKREQDPAWF